MKAPFYIISDNHFMMQDNIQENNRRKKLFAIFATIKKHKTGTLIIGGDFFDFWLESFYGVPQYYNDILTELEKYFWFSYSIR